MTPLAAGDVKRKALDALMSAIASKRLEISLVRNARLPLSELRERVTRAIDAEVERSGARGQLSRFDSAHPEDQALPREPMRPVDLAVYFGTDALVTKIIESAEADVPRGLPAGERRAKLGQLEAELRQLEHDEALEIARLFADGHAVLPRPDIDLNTLLLAVEGSGAAR